MRPPYKKVEQTKLLELRAGEERVVGANEDISDLPEHFDWRNVDGENYINPVENQGSCGSCYVHASLDAFISRVRIKTKNKMHPQLSVENVLECNQYGQGCQGGYGYLVGKYLQDFGAHKVRNGYRGLGESWTSRDTDRKSSFKKCLKGAADVRAEDYYYVGGYYGASNWKNMMKEIHENGPGTVSP